MGAISLADSSRIAALRGCRESNSCGLLGRLHEVGVLNSIFVRLDEGRVFLFGELMGL